MVSQSGSSEEEFDVFGSDAGCSVYLVDVVLFRLLCSDLVAARGTARVMADVTFVLVPLWNLNVGMKPVFRFHG